MIPENWDYECLNWWERPFFSYCELITIIYLIHIQNLSLIKTAISHYITFLNPSFLISFFISGFATAFVLSGFLSGYVLATKIIPELFVLLGVCYTYFRNKIKGESYDEIHDGIWNPCKQKNMLNEHHILFSIIKSTYCHNIGNFHNI